MDIAKYMDHAVLKPETTEIEVKKACEEAKKYGFYSVCVNGTNVAFAHEQLKGTDIKVAAVIGFPLGAVASEVKAFEAKNVIDNGAEEIDMVINIGALKEGATERVLNDIGSVIDAAKGRAIVKVIIETCLLTHKEKILACKLAKKAGADFVKTSTGFNIGGAIVEDVRLMREAVGPGMGIKASGGIRDFKTALAMIEAGATRIGASTSVDIVKFKQ